MLSKTLVYELTVLQLANLKLQFIKQGHVALGSCSSDVTAYILMKNDGVLYHHVTPTYFTQSLKTFFCTLTSCHFNFDPGTLL